MSAAGTSVMDIHGDRKLLAWLLGGVVSLIVVIALFTPRQTEEDKRPTTSNTGPQGARAAFLTLQGMGRTAVRWDEPTTRMARLDAAHTTLVLAEPTIPLEDRQALAAELNSFMARGGRVLLTGSAWRASLLPGGRTDAPGKLAPGTCETTPEGPGELAAAGSAEMEYAGTWASEGPQFRVEQRCLGKPVVVRYPVGAGEAVWWTSATPLTNAGLKRDANLRLLLASVGEGRAVLFDEYGFSDHAKAAPGSFDTRPLWVMFSQFVLLFLLLVWSFSRRKGPLRMPVTVPRSSPVEFTASMGGLYAKARATEPVIEAAQRRLERVLMSEAGLSRETVRGGADAIVETLAMRFGSEPGGWNELRIHLEQARSAESGVGGETLSSGDALRLVRAMASDEERLRAMLTSGTGTPGSGAQAEAASAEDKRLVGAER